MVTEGIEERASVYESLDAFGVSKLNSILKYKVKYLKDRPQIYNSQETEKLFKKISDGSLFLNSKHEAIEDHFTGNYKPVANIFKLLKFTIYFDALKEDLNPLLQWNALRQEISSKEMNETESSFTSGYQKKRMMKLETQYDQTGGANIENTEGLGEFDAYLGKRFVAPRVNNELGIPIPEKVRAANFDQRVNILEFVLKYGLHSSSIELLYRKFTLNYPENYGTSRSQSLSIKEF